MAFHELTVRAVEPLTDDSAAVTFDVPDDLRELCAFEPGESLTLRRVVDGVEHRRSYALCAATSASPPAPASRRCSRSPPPSWPTPTAP